ncbi:MAG: T9SS type A sorting domain-containing protein [Candidatus Fermentibacteraceae bacterium]|nr:T9SS type A sorting domain-containing protein [Candidatus Fermentibacteraceae bacterium]
MHLYPQPCIGILYFQFYSNAGDAVLSIFTLSGGYVESVNFGNTGNGETTLAYTGASSLASGVYFFRFSFGNTVKTGSFTVVR